MDTFKTISDFYEKYRGRKRIIGYSVLGNPIFALFAGKEEYPCVLVQYAIHAREWLTSFLALEHISRGVMRGGVWFVPLANPDGVALSQRGADFLKTLKSDLAAFLLKINKGKDFSLWKANARGVDLNVNFDAKWGTGKQNVRYPASANYIGSMPFSEPETRALAEFTKEVKPDATISYHTKGGEIYYGFEGRASSSLEKRLAAVLSEETGYPSRIVKGSAGGYKDWCVEKLNIPAFTIEAGWDGFSHPLGEEARDSVFKENGGVVLRLSEELWKIK